MARQKRKVSAFSLSFLDIMSCGFGAVVLLFLIIKHKVDTGAPVPVTTKDQTSEVMLLEEELLEGRENLARLKNTISEMDEQLVLARGMARRILEKIQETRSLTEQLTLRTDSVELDKIKLNIKKLEAQKKKLESKPDERGDDARKIPGDGVREYLTGLKIRGRHLLILMDTSASMLDNTIVNVIRFRNMRDAIKRNAEKWKNAVNMVEWLTAKFPVNSKYQIYTFNTDATSILPDKKGRWLDVGNKEELNKAIEKLNKIVPENGTDLEKAFESINSLRPEPDGIYLITDGLPTQGSKTIRAATITGKQRLNLFTRAVKKLPGNIPINVILAPMEGDTEAAYAFWRLALTSNGSFMSPTEDWYKTY